MTGWTIAPPACVDAPCSVRPFRRVEADDLVDAGLADMLILIAVIEPDDGDESQSDINTHENVHLHWPMPLLDMDKPPALLRAISRAVPVYGS
ncbi:hypothetical protein GCM10008915_68210 [Bifidobacterium pullorum subsp. gallinarum]